MGRKEANGNEARHPVFQQILGDAQVPHTNPGLAPGTWTGQSGGLTWAERSSPRATGGQQPHSVTWEGKDHRTPGHKHSPVSTAGTAQTVTKIQVDEGGVSSKYSVKL